MNSAILGVMRSSALTPLKSSAIKPGVSIQAPSQLPSSQPKTFSFDLNFPTAPAQATSGSAAGLSNQMRDMLLYQVKVGRFGLGLELVGKCSEALSSSVRRLEQGQG